MEDSKNITPKTPKFNKIETISKSIYNRLHIKALGLLIGLVIALNYKGASLHVDKLLVICDRLNEAR